MNVKKMLSLLLTLVMALSLAVPAMAAQPWYAEAQAYVTENGILQDTASGFDPAGTVDRATVLSAFYALEGKPTAKTGDAAEVWAGSFPGTELSAAATRGEFKTLLEAYAKARGIDASDLMVGDGTGNLMLERSITRAEFAQILLRLSKKAIPACSEVTDIQILATSDLHGKFYPWSYATNSAATSGSLTQLATAIKALRRDDTLLIDAGDLIQDNSAQIFLDEPIHPMMEGLNYMDYDLFVTGNHEYNFGMDTLRKVLATFDGKVLTGNVIDENGKPIADGYTIVERNGVKIGLIGMVTPNITRWDAANLAECKVTDPVVESRKIIEEIQDKVDLLVGVMHMGIENEYGVENSGVYDMANACPEFDLIISAHEHALIEGREINNVLVVQNKNMAQTMNEIHLYLGKTADGWTLLNRTSKAHQIKDYESDATLYAQLADSHEKAVADANVIIGKLVGGNLAPDNEIAEIPAAQVMDTAMIDLIQDVQMYYTGAKVSAAALFTMDAQLKEGDIHKSDSSLIYKYDNTLYKMQMTGAQLKKFMEWSASYFNQYKDGDLTISFSPDVRAYNYDMFAGVNYEIDISKPAGERIVNLTWPDGTPVKDDDSFVIAVNNYRC
ncbi:MAG: 5'-nucleotidase C-terminal domain-containing protein, partial [Oscillospiraceae bacterium]|nr:5'-nucleotidase C-terminal domain-containing protein [Oscillospiraceae bacterium]